VSEGYSQCPSPDKHIQQRGRWFFEVYPHPAHVVLFERNRIIKYKKGRIHFRRLGLSELRDEIRSRVFGPSTPFALTGSVSEFLNVDPTSLKGRQLKQHEDVLDGILCAYLAFHLWRWGWEQNEMLGDLDSGYVIVPRRPLRSDAALNDRGDR